MPAVIITGEIVKKTARNFIAQRPASLARCEKATDELNVRFLEIVTKHDLNPLESVYILDFVAAYVTNSAAEFLQAGLNNPPVQP